MKSHSSTNLAALLLVAAASGLVAASNITKSYVFKKTSELGYMHMSMIERLGDASTIIVGFQTAKKHEGDNDQKIVVKTSTDLGQSWSPHKVVVDGPTAVWGPVLQYDSASERLFLYYSVSTPAEARPSRGNASYPGGTIQVVTSTDQGHSWAGPRTLLSWTARGNVSKITANKVAISSNGTWILPFWQEPHTAADIGKACAGVLRSEDQGATWASAGCLQSKAAGWLIENSVAELEPGRLLMVFRTKCGKLYRSYSVDDGRTWEEASASELDNPNAKTSVYRLAGDAGVVLAYNPSKTARTPLALAVTHDGDHWTEVATIESDKENTFDYPTVMQIGAEIFTTYSADHHTAIKLAIVRLV